MIKMPFLAFLAFCHPASAATADSQAMLQQAYDLRHAGRETESLEALRKSVLADPTNRAALLELAYAEQRQRLWADAIAHFKAALALKEDEHVRMDLGYTLQNSGDSAGARQEFEAVAKTGGELAEQARQAATAVENAAVAGTLNDAYAALSAGEKDRARGLFQDAITRQPSNAAAVKQLAYLDLGQDRLQDAAKGFTKACALNPNDYTSQLQLGFIDYKLEDWKGAKAAFSAAAASPDPKQHETALSALRVTKAASRLVFLDVYGSPLYMSRFGDTIGYLESQLYFRPTPDSPVSFYMGTRYVQDSLSRGGTAPQIYSDNVWEIGPGIRIQPPGWEVSLSAEENLAFNLVRSASHQHNTEGDFRVTLAGYHDFERCFYGPIGLLTLGKFQSDKAFTDIGASSGYYTRYGYNVINYVQFREGAELWADKYRRLLGYLRANFAVDKNADFFNNVAEFGPGLEFWPWRSENIKLRAEYLRGVYYGRQNDGNVNPYGPNYNDFRVTLLFGARF